MYVPAPQQKQDVPAPQQKQEVRPLERPLDPGLGVKLE